MKITDIALEGAELSAEELRMVVGAGKDATHFTCKDTAKKPQPKETMASSDICECPEPDEDWSDAPILP